MTRIRPFLALAAMLLASACSLQLPFSGQTPTPTVALGQTRPPQGTPTEFPTWTAEPVTPTYTPTPTATPTPVVYAIQRGDTLLDVATRFGVSAADIQEINGITDPRLLQIGQELIIPAAPGAEAPGTPTPTPMPVHVVNQSSIHSLIGDAIVLGEILNDTPRGAEEVVVAIELRDANGHSFHTFETVAMLDVIAPNGRAPFAGVVSEAPAFSSIFAHVIRAVPEVAGRLTHRNLSVAETNGRSTYDRSFTVMGKVRNSGAEDALDVFVVVTLYAQDGSVVGASKIPVESPIPPGGRGLFEATIVPIMWPVESFEVVAEGRRPAPTPIIGPTETSTPTP